MKVSKETVRRLMIEKQGFDRGSGKAKKEDVFRTVDGLGCVQIDTINVVERAHHLTLWSRLGCYDKGLLHDLAYRDRRLFEYWAHAASYAPMKDYRYFLRPMEIRKGKMFDNVEKWANGDPEILKQVLERVKKEGPLTTKDFEHKRKGPSKGWWDWKPAKVALEALFGAGILLVSHRENFQRYYDLAERVLPAWVDTSKPTEKERAGFYALRTMGAIGLVNAPNMRQYYLPWSVNLRKTAKQWQALLEELVEQGKVASFEVEGENQPYFCLVEDVGRMQEIGDGSFSYEGVQLLNNFDNIMWDRERVRVLFDFEAKMETYIPAEKRKYGYYNLPILSGDRLVGRIVPKMDRKNGTLIIQSVWHEPWFEPDEAFEDGFRRIVEDFAEFNGADETVFEKEEPRRG